MRTVQTIVILGLVSIGVAPGAAEPYTNAFDGLESELIRVRDNEFPEPLDKKERKKLKAVVRSLALLVKEADDLGDDVKTAGKIERLLLRAFGDEYDEGSARAEELLDHVWEIRGELPELIEERRAALEVRQSGLSQKGHKKIRKLLRKSVSLELLALFAGRSWKRFGKSLKAVLKGHRVADRDPGGTGVTGLRAQIIDDTFEADGPRAEYDKSTGNLRLTGTATLKRGTEIEIDLTMYGVGAPGDYPLEPGTFEGTYNQDGVDLGIHPEFGTVTVTVLDPDAPRIAGVFRFVAGINEGGRFRIQIGEFNLTAVTVTGN